MTMTIDSQLPMFHFRKYFSYLAPVLAEILRTLFTDIISNATSQQITTNERSHDSSLTGVLEKKQRGKDRAAMRITLQQMKKTVHIYEDEETINEIERLRNVQFFCPKPLELLGLYLKNDYLEEEEDI